MSKLKKWERKWKARNPASCTYPGCTCPTVSNCVKAEAAPKLPTCTLTTSHDKRTIPAVQRALQGMEQAQPSTTAAWKDCTHPGLKCVFKLGESEIYGGAIRDLIGVHNAALVLRLAVGQPLYVPEATLPDKYESLRAHTRVTPDTIVIPWPDFGVPPVKPTFWAALIERLPPGKVIVCCDGGHGRTGTALASLLIVGMKMSAQDATKFVRDHHCEWAIESDGQERYLAALERWNVQRV